MEFVSFWEPVNGMPDNTERGEALFRPVALVEQSRILFRLLLGYPVHDRMDIVRRGFHEFPIRVTNIFFDHAEEKRGQGGGRHLCRSPLIPIQQMA